MIRYKRFEKWGLIMKSILRLVLVFSTSIGFAGYSGLGSESIDPAVVQSYAPKTLPKEITNPIQSLLDLRPQGAGLFDPNTKSMFFNWRITGNGQVWRIDKPQGLPVQMTGGALETSLLEVAPNGKFVILSRDADGEENPGLYIQSTKGGPVEVIQHKAKVQTHFSFVSDDSERIYYTSNDVKPDSYAIYSYDLKEKKATLLFSDDGAWGIADYLPTGELLLVLVKGALAREYFLYDPKTKTKTALLGQDENEEYLMSFSSQKNQYFVSTNKMSDFKKLYLWSKEKGFKEIPVLPVNDPQWDVESFSVDHSKEKIYVSINENGYSKLKVFSAQTFKQIAFPNFPDADHVVLRGVSPDGRYVSFSVSSSDTPRKTFVFDWKTKSLQNWIFPSTPELDPRSFPRAELEYYLSRDSVKIPLFVRRPEACKNKVCPVIVEFHGGPEGQATPGFSPFAQMFLDAGFVFVEPNVRGSEGYGKEWINSDNGPKRLKVITDLEDCATFIRKNWKVNGVSPKIGVSGYSYGGYSTLVAMSRFAGAYDAGVALVGMSNLVSFLENTAPYRRKLRISEYGDPKVDLEALKELSPINHIDKIKSPLLIVQGVNDPRVPAGEALQIHQTLQSKKIPSSLILFADEGHGSRKRSNQVLEIGHTIQFFKQHLLN